MVKEMEDNLDQGKEEVKKSIEPEMDGFDDDYLDYGNNEIPAEGKGAVAAAADSLDFDDDF